MNSSSNSRFAGLTELYRYESRRVWVDEDISHIKIMLSTFRIVKVTACGARIDTSSYVSSKTGTKFVNLDGRKQFACVTKEAAKHSFVYRKKRYVRILRAQLADVEEAIRIIEGRPPFEQS